MIAPERWQRIKSIFEAATMLPLVERTAYVRAAAGADAALASEIEALLLESEAMGDFLEPTALTGDLCAGERVGGFTLLSELGRGGMGVVWLAEQASPHRTVALKLLQPSAVSGAGVRRFRREAELLARLSHPFIAQVYEAGTDECHGLLRPWFALELVDGRPLDVFARENVLDARQKIALFLKVCDAVRHAHERGIVHRDLKPANILVTAQGDPKVLDFGIARASGLAGELPTLQTRTGLLLGTLDYMSPEQLAGDPRAVDARADVYALGVVLHELLAGRRPHVIENRPLPESVRRLCEEEPLPISTWDKRLKGDIETIVAKALEKDRERRYASAAELALDLERHLDERPIAARPASTAYQLRKFARRNKVLVAGLIAVVLSLAAGTFGTTRGMWSAQAAEALANTRRLEAERAAHEAREVQTFLADILGSIEPDVAAGQDTTLVRRMLESAARRIEGRFGDQPLVEATLRTTLGRSYESLGLYDEARAHHERALALLRQHAPPGGPEIRGSLAALGSVFMQIACFPEAEAAFAEALALGRSNASAQPRALAVALDNLAQCLAQQRRFAEAVALYSAARDELEQLEGGPGADLPPVLAGLGEAHLFAGRTDLAEPILVEALAAERRVHPEPHTQWIRCLTALGALYWRKQDYAAASDATREALETARQLYGDVHPSVGMLLSNLATLRQQAGDLEQAETLGQESLAMARAMKTDEHPSFAIKLRNLGLVKKQRGGLAEAEELYRQALALERRVLPPSDPGRLETLFNLAKLLSQTERKPEALELLREALALGAAALGADHPTTRLVQGEVAKLSGSDP